jgi:hypothetical protein
VDGKWYGKTDLAKKIKLDVCREKCYWIAMMFGGLATPPGTFVVSWILS